MHEVFCFFNDNNFNSMFNLFFRGSIVNDCY